MNTVTLGVWRLPAHDVPAAVVAGRVTARRLRRSDTVTFAKVLGTASDAFVPTAATPRRWVTLASWRDTPTPGLTRWWARHAEESATLTLRPLWSRGRWDGAAPFPVEPQRWDGPVVALTRSTVRVRKAATFYRAVPGIASELRRANGCRAAFGIGEAPVLRQGTISIWDSAAAMQAFAYATPAHVAAVEATPTIGWYAEELFTRFALLDAEGTIDGASVR